MKEKEKIKKKIKEIKEEEERDRISTRMHD